MKKSDTAVIQGQRLKEIRLALNLTQEEMPEYAKRYNVVYSRPHYTMMENGTRDLNLDIITVLVLHFRVNMVWLLSGEETMFTKAPAKLRALSSASLKDRLQANTKEIQSIATSVKILRQKMKLEREAAAEQKETKQIPHEE